MKLGALLPSTALQQTPKILLCSPPMEQGRAVENGETYAT